MALSVDADKDDRKGSRWSEKSEWKKYAEFCMAHEET